MQAISNVVLTAALGFGGFLGLFGLTHHGSTTPPAPSPREHAHAASTDALPQDIACINTAVATREASLDMAVTTETNAITTAYTTRASALASAYAQPDTASIRAAVVAAWKAFSISITSAHKDSKTAQQAAWSQFRAAVQACGGNAASVSDSSNASLDDAAGGTTNVQ